MIRTLVPDVMRYGRAGVADDYSHLGESIFDHPYQWGSKRTGPDLAHEGGPIAKDAGQTLQLHARRQTRQRLALQPFPQPAPSSPGSNMPAYPWLFEKETDVKPLPNKIAVQVKLGVPWPALNQHEIPDMVETQAQEIAKSLVDAKVYLPAKPDLQGDDLRNHLAKSQVVAVIAYLQKLGAYREIKKDASRRTVHPRSGFAPQGRPPRSKPAPSSTSPPNPTTAMFQRMIVEDWALCIPIISFFIFAMVFVLVTIRALRLGEAERTRLASLPLDDHRSRNPETLKPP